MREACKIKVQIHNGNILMSSVIKDPGVSSILLFSGSGINFQRPLYVLNDPKIFLVLFWHMSFQNTLNFMLILNLWK
jgi:hypothetical protein